MFGHLCSACEEAMRILLTSNSRSIPVYVIYQDLFPRNIHCRNGTLLKWDRKVSMTDKSIYDHMIGHLILFADETPTVAKVYFITHLRLLPT